MGVVLYFGILPFVVSPVIWIFALKKLVKGESVAMEGIVLMALGLLKWVWFLVMFIGSS